jgi:hypothetical protein
MAYLHCHNCPWSQDDFWHLPKEEGGDGFGYMPFDRNDFEEIFKLLSAAVQDPSKRMVDNYDRNFFEEHFGTSEGVDVRQFVAWNLERRARQIRGMVWMTYDDYKNDSDKRCPRCGSGNLDID